VSVFFDTMLGFAAKGGLVMAAYAKVHIGLYPEHIQYASEPSEVIYAGSIVDSRIFPSIVDGYGSTPFFFIRVPRMIGTHGVLIFQDCPDRLYLAGMAVPEQYFGTGVASLLLGKLEKIAQERGKESTALKTLLCNHRARRFFAKHGYIEHEAPNYYGQEDWVIMIKKITA
jgi:ribosomal protein S18 acetylase RimI-like enzyme